MNTKFFYLTTDWRKENNMFKGMRIHGEWCEDQKIVNEGVKAYYEDGLKEKKKGFNLKLGNVDFRSISLEYNDRLTKIFSEDEIRKVVWDCESNKNLRRDGFNFSFIKKF